MLSLLQAQKAWLPGEPGLEVLSALLRCCDAQGALPHLPALLPVLRAIACGQDRPPALRLAVLQLVIDLTKVGPRPSRLSNESLEARGLSWSTTPGSSDSP